ncbi:unnamed protein product [Tilletia laevis]|uniref:Zn(2)-C6 fungal-type domain-containing protein n=1 Tax=Tilletia laevis TaxID=157183 RepID=A0A9N8M294_9BASI|nr:unnamed protein product [Tilletia laevis]CAD6982347.1 unnamed protein product [Tilletia controversa]
MHTAPSSFLPSSHIPRNGTALPPPPVPTVYSRPQPQPSSSHPATESTSMSKKTGAKAATATVAAAAATTTALSNNNQAQQQSQSAMDEDIDGDGDADDPNKRRRVARACDSCRKKKVRCDGIDPPHREACTNCSTYGHECKFLNAAKRRAPPRSYVDALEARMARMEALVSWLAPGVDFTDKVGPPVVLPDIGDNADDPNAAAVVANTTVSPPTANSGFVPPTASIEAIHKSNFESNFGHSMPADLDQGEEEPENIGILLQHKIDRFEYEFHSSTGDSAMVDGIHRSNSSPDSETNGTSDGSAGSAEGTTSGGGGGGGSNGSRPPLSASDSAPKLTHRNDISILSTDKLAEGHEHSNQLDQPDTAVFFGHSSNFMLYPQLEKLSLGMAQNNNPHRMHFMQHSRCIPIADIYAETVGPPLESIDLHWPEPDLQDALVDAYFESAHPNIPIVNEAIFRDELANQPELRKDRHFLNLCLGIFSIASRFVDDERLMTHPAQNVHTRWQLGIQWLEPRKQLGFRMFPTNLSLCQLQGLILSSFFLQDTPVGGTMGWALLGVAIRLMQAHGVHRRAVNRARQLPVHIDEQWKRCFWVCYNLDVELSSNMGRPIGVHEDDFDLEFPLEVDDDVLWEAGKAMLAARSQAQAQQQGSAGTGPSPSPTSTSGPSASTSEPNTNTTSTSSPSTSTFPRASVSVVDSVAMQGNRPVKFMTSFNAMSKLNMIMARILRTIYMLPKARIARGYVGSQAPQFVVAEIDSALNEWINSIPRRIRFDPHEADDGLLLQSSYVAMRYYNSQILTHRPFISGTRQENPNFASLAICTNAARSCSHILDSLRKRGLLVNASMATVGHAFIAGCVLLMVVWSARKSGARLSSSTLSDVAKCVEALRAAEKR